MLPKYHRHMNRHGRKSLLTRFCGMYGVRIYNKGSADHGQLHIFVVMNAVFPAEGSHFISERFDLKGSTVGREVSDTELREKGSNAVLKDLDLAREVEVIRKICEPLLGPSSSTHSVGYGLQVGRTAKSALLSQLREDVAFLVDCQVMDYSLLVGIVNMEKHVTVVDKSVRNAMVAMQRQGRKLAKNKKWHRRVLHVLGTPVRLVAAPPMFIGRQICGLTKMTYSSLAANPLPYDGSGECGVDVGIYSVIHGHRKGHRSMYYMGLIDFLQPWTTRKVLERRLKGLIGYDTKAISCVSPEEYAVRFLEFLDSNSS